MNLFANKRVEYVLTELGQIAILTKEVIASVFTFKVKWRDLLRQMVGQAQSQRDYVDCDGGDYDDAYDVVSDDTSARGVVAVGIVVVHPQIVGRDGEVIVGVGLAVGHPHRVPGDPQIARLAEPHDRLAGGARANQPVLEQPSRKPD